MRVRGRGCTRKLGAVRSSRPRRDSARLAAAGGRIRRSEPGSKWGVIGIASDGSEVGTAERGWAGSKAVREVIEGKEGV